MNFVKAFFKRPWIIIALTVILTGLFGSFIVTLVIDNSIRQFMPQKDGGKRLILRSLLEHIHDDDHRYHNQKYQRP